MNISEGNHPEFQAGPDALLADRLVEVLIADEALSGFMRGGIWRADLDDLLSKGSLVAPCLVIHPDGMDFRDVPAKEFLATSKLTVNLITAQHLTFSPDQWLRNRVLWRVITVIRAQGGGTMVLHTADGQPMSRATTVFQSVGNPTILPFGNLLSSRLQIYMETCHTNLMIEE